ncbi:hypothetical protein [Bacillus sp. NPDC094106]|uniref:hypothetical protein n=1 Tax=Bacillus sp. NPDC094106 TaxID=3363949 RepID=UPI003821B48E
MGKRIENILWHIEHNRKTLGDTQVLDDVENSLRNLQKELSPLSQMSKSIKAISAYSKQQKG